MRMEWGGARKGSMQTGEQCANHHRHHTGLQTRRRPLEVTVATMKASLNEYREKLKQQENKVKVSIL